MTNSKKDSHNRLSKPSALFDSLEKYNVALAFRGGLSKELSRLSESRYMLAARLSEMTQRNIGKDTLDKNVSSDLRYSFHVEDVPALIAITGSVEPMRLLFEPVGYSLIGQEETELLKLARLEQEKNRIDAEIATLEMKLKTRKVR